MDNALARHRKQRGLTQKQLADMTDLRTSYISRLEIGERSLEKLSLDIAARLAAALGIHAEELLDE
jgi:transcriptional regulator with XRE-family HTH domain